MTFYFYLCWMVVLVGSGLQTYKKMKNDDTSNNKTEHESELEKNYKRKYWSIIDSTNTLD